jgi:hydroxymethylpyrimidine/phosphomethylpyrimidine kinase
VVSEDFSVKGVKIGMLPTLDSVEAVVEALQTYSFPNVVYDPIMVSSTGQTLMNIEVRREIIQRLSPLLDLITPNIHEAEWILSKNISSVEDMISSSQELEQQLGCSVLLKGGHLDSDDMVDVLCDKGEVHLFSHQKIISSNLHGTGCTLSSAIATYLALGNNLPEAVRLAKEYLSSCIQNSHIMQLGKGCGPMWHF